MKSKAKNFEVKSVRLEEISKGVLDEWVRMIEDLGEYPVDVKAMFEYLAIWSRYEEVRVLIVREKAKRDFNTVALVLLSIFTYNVCDSIGHPVAKEIVTFLAKHIR